MLIDARGALTRIPSIFPEVFGGTDDMGPVGRIPLPPTPPDAIHRRFAVRPHELDPMDHANNAIYLDWLEEAILASAEPADARAATTDLPRRYRMEFALAADAGAELDGAAWRETTAPAGATAWPAPTAARIATGRAWPAARQRPLSTTPQTRRRLHDPNGADRRPRVRWDRQSSRPRRRGDREWPDRRLGTGLDGDAEVDVRERTILPGLFDCHTHVCISNVDLWGHVQQPFSRQFYEAAKNLRKTLAVGITSVA